VSGYLAQGQLHDPATCLAPRTCAGERQSKSRWSRQSDIFSIFYENLVSGQNTSIIQLIGKWASSVISLKVIWLPGDALFYMFIQKSRNSVNFLQTQVRSGHPRNRVLKKRDLKKKWLPGDGRAVRQVLPPAAGAHVDWRNEFRTEQSLVCSLDRSIGSSKSGV